MIGCREFRTGRGHGTPAPREQGFCRPPASTRTHLPPLALTCTHLHLRWAQARCKCALGVSAVQVCAGRKRGASVRCRAAAVSGEGTC